ncbi:alpha/beta hydrolase [Streptomyces sp. NPDC059122]|uniref:alpha/beta hydrolase n=1 Tax=Streptomyces sp. NPDC059122 TaxID=3346732 RepID=UPI0036AA36CA
MTPRLVFVHGIGPHRVIDKELHDWRGALASGAEAAGHGRLVANLLQSRALDVRFAYYGDLFFTPGAQGAGMERGSDGDVDGLSELLIDAINERLAQDPDQHEARKLNKAKAQLLPEGEAQGAGEIVRQIISAANTLSTLPGLRTIGGWTSAAIMIAQLNQVRRYLDRKGKGEDGLTLDARIRDRVTKEFNPSGPTIVVAHSLGTVVAFEALHDYDGAVPLFVTLGSPIGMRTAVQPHMRPQPLQAPHTVRRWLNFWDRDDIVVANPQLHKWVAPNSASVAPVSRRVDSDGAWVHPAAKYLAQSAVAGPVMEALEGVSTI